MDVELIVTRYYSGQELSRTKKWILYVDNENTRDKHFCSFGQLITCRYGGWEGGKKLFLQIVFSIISHYISFLHLLLMYLTLATGLIWNGSANVAR